MFRPKHVAATYKAVGLNCEILHLLMLHDFVTVTFHIVMWWCVTPYILVHCLYRRQRYICLPVDRLSQRRCRWSHYPGKWRCMRGWSERTVRRTHCLHLQGSTGQQVTFEDESRNYVLLFEKEKPGYSTTLAFLRSRPKFGSGIFVRNVGAPTSLHGVISTIMYNSHCITTTCYDVLWDRKPLTVVDMCWRFGEINGRRLIPEE
jgi:hypothetical protein